MIIKEITIYDLDSMKKGEYAFTEFKNVLIGNNRSGKSTILKSIMYTLGYEVITWKENWKPDEKIYVLKVLIGKNAYTITRYNNRFSINQDTFTEKKEFSKWLREILNLDLQMLKGENFYPINPNLIFAYTYIDQDSGWYSEPFITSNPSKGQYDKKAFKNLYEQFTGVNTIKLLELEKEKNLNKKEIDNNEVKIDVITEAKKVVVKLEENEKVNIDFNEIEKVNKFFKAKVSNSFSELANLNRKVEKKQFEYQEQENVLNEIKEIIKAYNRKGIVKYKCSYCNSEHVEPVYIKDIEQDISKKNLLLLQHTYDGKKRETVTEIKNLNKEIKDVKNNLRKINEEFNEIHFQGYSLKELMDLNYELKKSNELDQLLASYHKRISELNFLQKKLSKDIKKLKDENDINKKNELALYTTSKKLIANLFDVKGEFGDKFAKIKTTGSDYNIYFWIEYYAILSSIIKYGMVKLPIVYDGLIKEEHDSLNYTNLGTYVNEHLLNLDSQIFFSYVPNEKYKILDNDKINKIYIKKNICNKEIFDEEISIVLDR